MRGISYLSDQVPEAQREDARMVTAPGGERKAAFDALARRYAR
jgi:hypothetical protein